MIAWGWVLAMLAVSIPAGAEIVFPPGFTAETYVTGQGFESGSERGAPGIPATSTLGFDGTGLLYLARTGARFRGGEVEDLAPIYRMPVGGARITSATETRYFHGPPLRNPQVGTVRGRGEVFITTHDRDRKIGALYRMIDGRPVLFAGGTPTDGGPPLLRLPEGVAVDATGHVYVADRDQGAVVQLDPTGRVVHPRYVSLLRPRMLATDERGQLWIAGDGTAETPWQDGAGEIWRVSPEGTPSLVLKGPLVAGMSLTPGGALVVAQRRTGQLFIVTDEGKRIEFASSTEGTAFRGLAFAPVTPETRRAGIGGDLFGIVVNRQMWALNEVIRISGPFDEFMRQRRLAAP